MSGISDVLNTEAGSYANTKTTTNQALGKDDFLKLLVTQLNNQDPLEPVKNEQFVAQLATFSNLEQLVSVNEKLDSLNATQSGQSSSGAVSFIGKDVRAIGDWVDYAGTGNASVNYELLGAAEEVTLTVKDESGNVIRTQKITKQDKGDHQWIWDGKNKDGSPMKAGTYTIGVEATDQAGNAVKGFAVTTGHVDGISYEQGYPELMLGTHKISLSDIIKVMENG